MSFLNGNSYLALPHDPKPWLIKHLVPVGGLVNIYGKPKTGKSFAALGMAHAIATDTDTWLGFDVLGHGKVAYLQIDTPRSSWALRLNTITDAGYDFDNVFFADRLIAPYPFNILDPSNYQWLQDKIGEIDPVMVVIDTLREVHEADENESGVMKQVITGIDTACGEKAAKLLVSHSRKDQPTTNEDDIMDGNRGSSYVPGKMDSILKLTNKYLMYDGRSVEAGKTKVVQCPETGLILLDDSESTLQHTIKAVMAEMKGKGFDPIAREVAKRTGASASTVKRRMEKMLGPTQK